jgi:hypothetical protein
LQFQWAGRSLLEEVAMTKARLLLAVSALVVAGALPLVARGNAVTVRLEVSGAALSKAVHVTNRDLLEMSNVYGGQFLGVPADSVDSGLPRYVVSLVVESRTPMPALAPTGTYKRYTFHYALDRRSGKGFIYLPGRGEDGYRGNIGLIIRDDHDGRWHHASETWAALLNPYLP